MPEIFKLFLSKRPIDCGRNEGSGVSDETLSVCTDRVTIPMAGKAESLNAAAAAAIAMFVIKQKENESS